MQALAALKVAGRCSLLVQNAEKPDIIDRTLQGVLIRVPGAPL